MQINLNKTKKTILALVILIEIIIGSVFLFNFYQQKIVHKAQDPNKVTVIKKENLIFPEESEFKYYWELKPNTIVIDEPEWLGYQAKYTYNADGLNERFNYEVEKSSNTFRIITLGDSFTYGQFVNTKDNWTERLEDLLNKSLKNNSKIKKFEVINLGLGGFDVPYLVKRYKDIGAKYKPDLIIWFESGEGFYRMVELIMPIANVCEKEISVDDKKKEYNYCWNRAGERIHEKYSEAEIANLIMDDLSKLFSSLNNGEQFLLFTYQEEKLGDIKLNALKKWEERFSAIPNVTFASVIPGTYELGQSLADGHPNVQGHETISKAIYEYLNTNVINKLE